MGNQFSRKKREREKEKKKVEKENHKEGEREEENHIFLIHGLGKCEGVGEDSRHGNEHLDIQVGSRIYLSVCLNRSIAYALRWRVTHLG